MERARAQAKAELDRRQALIAKSYQLRSKLDRANRELKESRIQSDLLRSELRRKYKEGVRQEDELRKLRRKLRVEGVQQFQQFRNLQDYATDLRDWAALLVIAILLLTREWRDRRSARDQDQEQAKKSSQDQAKSSLQDLEREWTQTEGVDLSDPETGRPFVDAEDDFDTSPFAASGTERKRRSAASRYQRNIRADTSAGQRVERNRLRDQHRPQAVRRGHGGAVESLRLHGPGQRRI